MKSILLSACLLISGPIINDLIQPQTDNSAIQPIDAIKGFISQGQYILVPERFEIKELHRKAVYTDSQITLWSKRYRIGKNKLNALIKGTQSIEYGIRVWPKTQWPDNDIKDYILEYTVNEGNKLFEGEIRTSKQNEIELIKNSILVSLTNGNGGRHWQYLYHPDEKCRTLLKEQFDKCKGKSQCYDNKELNSVCNYIKLGTYEPGI